MNKRRLGALGLSAVVAGGAILASPAGAAGKDVKEAFAGSARATALHINVLGTDLTLTDTFAEVNFDQIGTTGYFARSNATEVLTPIFTSGGEIAAEATKPGQSADSTADTCTFSALTVIPLLKNLVDVGCPRVTATMDANQNPSAQSLGAQLKIDVSISNLLDTLGLRDEVAGDRDKGDDGLDDTVIDATLGSIAESLTSTPIGELVDDTVQTVDDLVEDVLGLDAVVRLAVAPAVSEITSTDDLVDVHAKAQALRLELLPLDTLNGQHPNRGKYDGILEDLAVGEPLLTIVIGEAEGRQQLDRSGATPKLLPATGNAALARIKVGGVKYPLVDQLAQQLLVDLGLGELLTGIGADLSKINVKGVAEATGNLAVTFDETNREFVVKGPGTLTLLDGTALETSLILADVKATAEGFAGSGAKLHAVKGVQGGILASLADISGSAGGTGVKVIPNVIETPRELPRTGGTPTTALVGMVLLGLALGSRRLLSSRSAA